MDDQPPIYREGDDYENWRSSIIQWKRNTKMDEKRQALAVRAKLAGKLRDVALKLDAGDLNKESGINFLLDRLDDSFRKEKRRKWDVPAENTFKTNTDTKEDELSSSPQSAAEKARLRASKLSAKLAAEGKYHAQPMSLLPSAISNPVDQFSKGKRLPTTVNNAKSLTPITLPEVKKLDTGGYLAEFDINDVKARVFLMKGLTQELIEKQSGASVTLRGKFLTEEEKRKFMFTGVNEKPLTMLIEADVGAKVQVAIHRISQVINNYVRNGGADINGNNFGLTQEQQSQQHIQDKLFVGLDDVPIDFFDVKKALTGDNNENFQFVIQQTGAKVTLRGRNSGYLEQNSGRESFEALHILISHPRQDGLESARQLCGNLIDTVRGKADELRRRPPLNNPFGPTALPQYQGSRQPRPPHGIPLHGMPPQRMPHHQMQYPPFPVSPQINGPSINTAPRHLYITEQERPRYDVANHQSSNYKSDDRYADRKEEVHRRFENNFNNVDKNEKHKRNEHDKSRSRSRSRSRSPHKTLSRFRRDKSRSPEDSEKHRKRTFTEEPKKRRKFSEDPKLLEKTYSVRSEEKPKFREDRKKEFKKDENSFVPPPPMPPFVDKSKEKSVDSSSKKNKESIDTFKVPSQFDVVKPLPKALKIGALSTLAAYDDEDSNSD